MVCGVHRRKQLTFSFQRIYHWLRNHLRSHTAGTGKARILKIARKRKMHPHQAYLAVYRDELMPEILEAYNALSKPRPKKIKFINDWARETLKDESLEVKSLVAEVVSGKTKISDLGATPAETHLRQVRERQG